MAERLPLLPSKRLVGQREMTTTAAVRGRNHRNELIVLSLIGGGLILILILIICGVFGWFESKVNQPLPNWAENVLVALATTAGLKLGDVLAALVQLATGRHAAGLGEQLAHSSPNPQPKPPPQSAKDAAEDVAEAAEERKDEIVDGLPRPTFDPEDE